MRARGFTLMELVVVLAVAGLLAAATLPTMLSRLTASRRADATLALERLQIAQERHRALNGLYAGDTSALGVPANSPEGLYELSVNAGPDERYVAIARPRAGGLQAGDDECAEITLDVVQGFATAGPSRRCWNR
jgi:type IV pilus assembly protein PilE